MLSLLPVPTADRLPLRAGHGVHPEQVPLPGSPAITRLPSSPLGPVALPLSPCKALVSLVSQRRSLSLSLSLCRFLSLWMLWSRFKRHSLIALSRTWVSVTRSSACPLFTWSAQVARSGSASLTAQALQ